jgi:plastocyanin
MTPLFFTIILILFASLVIPTLQNAIAIPYVSPQDLYKQSDMVFYGQVITKQTGPGPDYVYYQVQVKAYFKNPQTSDSITVAGHKPDNKTGIMSYPQFDVGDKAIFYINKLDGINTISPYSQIAGEACDVRSFVEPYALPSPPTLGGVAQATIYIEDANENMPYIPLVNHTIILRDENVWNNSPESRIFPVTLTIQNEDTGQQVFNQTQNLEIQACSGPETVKWNFVPTQIANYVASVSGNKNEISTIFQAIYDSTKSPILSPLKQFKSGVAANNVICRPDMQLLIQNQENFPICVKLDTVPILLYRDWSYPTNCKYVHDPFTAGVAGLVMIEKNASDPSTGKSYSPRNSTVVIGWNNTVSWINQDDYPSSVTSDWNLFDSGSILSGNDWKHNFDCAGNYGYHSEPHPWMKGWIRVLPPSR